MELTWEVEAGAGVGARENAHVAIAQVNESPAKAVLTG